MLHTFGGCEAELTHASGFAAFYETDAATQLRRDILARIENADVVSFDIFDTLLLRDGKSELERFHDVAKRFIERDIVKSVLPSTSARAMLVARVTCARTAYQLGKRVEGTTEGRLDDIAAGMMDVLRVVPNRRGELAELWCDTELEVENEQLYPSEFVLSLIRNASELGKRSILVTDMYLDGTQVRRLLSASGVDPEMFFAISSSADTVVNKRTGTVFPFLDETLGIEAGRALHFGDSLVSDYLRPCQCGWMAQHLPVPDALIAARRESHDKMLEDLFGSRNFPLPISKPSF